MGPLCDNVRRLSERIAVAARHAGQDPAAITLVAVTKTVPAAMVNEALAIGLRDFGENRIQEAKAKIPAVTPGARWHLIGHLQTNKVQDAVALFDLIQSVDSFRLGAEISRRAQEIGKKQDVLLQVHTTGEDQKSGCKPDEAEELAARLAVLPGVRLRGLMTIGPLTEEVAQIRTAFRLLKRLFDRLSETGFGRETMIYVSMGMSGDFEIALQEGANMLRIGTAIFGPRERDR